MTMGVHIDELPEGMNRRDFVHGTNEEDLELDCTGCPDCADPDCLVCKGEGRIKHGYRNSWQCGCTFAVPGTEGYASRIARDLKALTLCPSLPFRRDCLVGQPRPWRRPIPIVGGFCMGAGICPFFFARAFRSQEAYDRHVSQTLDAF